MQIIEQWEQTMPIRGNIDRLDGSFIEGWAVDDEHPSYKFAFDVMVGDRVIGRFVADGFRQDLQDANIGDGECAFSFAMPVTFDQRDLPQLRLRFADSNIFVTMPVSARSLGAMAEAAE